MNKGQELLDGLKSGKYTCVIEKDGEWKTSMEHGIMPLLKWIHEEPSFFRNANVYDRVVGKAAAMLFRYGKIHSLYTMVISTHAKQAMVESEIPFTADKEVPYIINRRQDGMCPMEETVLTVDDVEMAYHLLDEKVKNMKPNE